jgi:hypothetical protein
LIGIPKTICFLKKDMEGKISKRGRGERGEVEPCVAPYPGPTAFRITSF